ncbi:hypothetical protein VNO77_02674 [Canavalia gladiata]|uniref:Uncharacterized protein n=1 Tax=Canavalia gladiata TaxID=3824 RepID=A0AAN9R385_CANGL
MYSGSPDATVITKACHSFRRDQLHCRPYLLFLLFCWTASLPELSLWDTSGYLARKCLDGSTQLGRGRIPPRGEPGVSVISFVALEQAESIKESRSPLTTLNRHGYTIKFDIEDFYSWNKPGLVAYYSLIRTVDNNFSFKGTRVRLCLGDLYLTNLKLLQMHGEARDFGSGDDPLFFFSRTIGKVSEHGAEFLLENALPELSGEPQRRALMDLRNTLSTWDSTLYSDTPSTPSPSHARVLYEHGGSLLELGEGEGQVTRDAPFTNPQIKRLRSANMGTFQPFMNRGTAPSNTKVYSNAYSQYALELESRSRFHKEMTTMALARVLAISGMRIPDSRLLYANMVAITFGNLSC